MNTSTILVAILAIALSGISALAQRGGTGRDTVSGRTTPGIGAVGMGSPNWNEGTARNPNTEINFNEKLANKLKTLLPEGTDPHVASKGFGDLKAFVATVRVANNLKVPFA